MQNPSSPKLEGLFGLTPESTAFLRLDLLRFIAAMGIVVFHFAAWLGPQNLYVGGLQIFVDVFFVVSGIVISHVYLSRVGNWRQIGKFLLARLARLAPLHWLTTAAYVLLGLAATIAGLQLTDPEKYDPACLPAVLTFTHAMGGCDKLVYNFVSWSISAEFAMYALFPIFAIVAARSKHTILAGFLMVLGTLYLADRGWWTRTYDFSVLRALPGFLLGITLHLWREELARLPVPGWFFFPTIVALVAMMLLVREQGLIVLCAYAAVMLIYAMDRRTIPGRAMIRLSALGQLTYSAYMLHPLVQTVFLNAIGKRILDLQGTALTLYAWATVLLLLVFSYLSLLWVETPSRNLIRRTRREKIPPLTPRTSE